MRFLNFTATLLLVLLFAPGKGFSQAPDLGLTASFALFTAAGAFNGDPGSSVTGDIGTNVGAFTPPGFLVGNIHISDPVTAQAAADVAVAYGFLDGLTCGLVLNTPFGNNQSLTPNIYCIGSAAVLNATLTLDGGGDPGSIFIFQIDGALSTNPGSNIVLTNGANLCNVYWQVNGAFNHNGTTFQGTVIAAGALNFGTGAQLTGRGLSTMGAINMSANNVTLPNGCLCELDVTCPDPDGGSFSCINNIPVGAAADVTVNSACGTPAVTISNTSTGSGCLASPYVLTRTYTVTDEGGHSTDCVVTYTAIDQTAPTITCPAGLFVSCANNVPAATPASVVTSDNCGGAVSVVSLGDVISNQTCANRYTITRTYRASDFCGSTATCSQTITVNDIAAPSITCPANIVVSCASAVPAPDPASITATDLCGGAVTVVLVGDVITPGICANRFTVTRTYLATDLCGNLATCAQIITVNDITAPSITCPANVTVSCASAVPPASPASVIATDLCGGAVTLVLVDDVITPGTCANRFTVTRTYSATDLCFNTATCAQIITVNDITAPSISCPANVTVSCAGNVPAAAPASVIASDLCGGTVTVVLVGDVITPGTCANRFTITRTYSATDLCGNSATCAQIITVNDITAPSISCPANVLVSCASDVPAAAPASVIASDNCGGAVTVVLVGDVITPGACANRFTVTRTYRATDLCGNSATCAQIITVNDIIAPTIINPPVNVTVECFLIPAVPPLPTATDNCAGTVIVTLLSEIQTPGICPTLYTLTRTWRATDVCGNSATVSQVITVIDTYAPQFTVPPVDVVLECDLNTNEDTYQDWLDNHGGAVVFDCSEVTWTWIYSPLFTMPSECGGTSQRLIRFIATDECGNSAFLDARFTIIDTTPPIFTVLPQNLFIDCWMGEQGEAQIIDWLDNYGFAEVTDACGSVETSVVFLSETQDCPGTFHRTYQFRATDECGNTTFVTANFGIIDTVPPVIMSCPESNVLLTCEFDIPAADPAGVKAMDMCSAVTISVIDSFSVGVGCEYWQMTKSYVYAATDACGNVSTCYQSFQVVDSIPPIYSGPDTIFVPCVSDLPGPGDIEDVLAQYFVDNCYTIICVNESVVQNSPTSVTFCVNFKDLCVNWAPKMKVTFIANGGCKPICSVPQATWGNTSGEINGNLTTEVIQQLISKNGAVKAGKLGKLISVTSATCLQNMLPGNGTTAQFSPGKHTFSSANECNSASSLLNADGTLKNKVAANVLALQLNIWYNQTFNERNLGVQTFSSMPSCLVDSVVLGKLEVDHANVQGLLHLSNDYLAGVGFYPQNFGTPLNNALENVSSFWQNCQMNDPCSISNNLSVAGKLITENQEGMQDGTILLSRSSNNSLLPDQLIQTDVAGAFEFTNAIPFAGEYQITPASAGMEYLNGVTTYDLVLISKHILGLTPFNSAYKMIAADANRSGSITTLDIVELRKLILGTYEELPNNTAWRFVDQSFVFPNPFNPFSTAFPENKTKGSVQGSQMAEDFVSVKIGDVNGTAKANGLIASEARSSNALLFDLDNRMVRSGEIFEVKMRADQIVEGYQFTLHTEGLEVLEVSGKQMSLSNFAVFNSEAALTTSWSMPEGTTAEVAEFTLKFRATQSGQLNEMLGISSRITLSEAYNAKESNDSKVMDVALRFHDNEGSIIRGNEFELYQNAPNPFVDKTVIAFNLPEATQATLTIYDQTGRLVYTQVGDFAKGYNTFSIDGQLISTTGTLLYKLETATNLAIRKMIQIK